MVGVVPPPSPRARLLGVHVELLLVFGFVWLALGGYSIVEREMSVGETPLVKTEIRDLVGLGEDAAPEDSPLAPPVEPAAPGEVAPASAPTASAAAPALPPLDDKPQRIMIVGDSMVVNLIPPLADYCLENGHKLFPVIWYASTTIAWASQSKLNDCIREFSPTYVIMVLGASELGARKVDSRASSVRMINERIGDRHFFWLGPPNWRKDTGFNDMLLKTVGKDHFFRSADIELERESDGIHPTRAAGRKWADLFARWMATEAAVRIKMNEPTKKAITPSAKVYPPPYKVPDGYAERHKK